MKHFAKVIFALIFFINKTVLAQDERQFRDFFHAPSDSPLSSSKIDNKDPHKEQRYLFKTDSPFYEYDLNRDGSLEFIKLFKKDDLNFFVIYDKELKKTYEEKIPSIGHNTWIYRLHLSKINTNTSLILIYFFEGETGNIQKVASSRLYFLTYENNDLNTCSLFKGPIYETEMTGFPTSRYSLRQYNIEIKDINNDQQNEVVVDFNGITQKIYFYKSQGKWSSI